MTTNSFFERISQLSPKRLALLAMDLQARLEAAERQRNEPIAIVGMACRFPGGANSPDQFWQLLQNGVDAITEVPASRWSLEEYYDPDPDAPGKVASRWAGFIDDVDRFDPQFFGISPREAVSMDPQQRLVLEVGWEALENAGYAPDKLSGSRTGVFMGICNNDYFQLLTAAGEENLDTYTATGGAHSVASGRLSYILGLQGPSLSVDTACSSSLVAIYLAVQSLRAGECRMAIAGGVNVLASVEVTIALSRGHMMAADGRCKAFDAAADGFVRSEGCGLVVLKRLSHALADGDNILAVIRGAAINQDGRSNGLTAPNGPSQEAVIRDALANAGIQPADVSYVETHGTGTSLGDPIEVQALGAAFSEGRPADQPLAIGSVKTNIGHLESAAGVAGLMKLVLALQHGEIPPHLHLRELNPYIPWADLPVVVPTQRTPWQAASGRRIGGISSFGFSGTNVHLVVEEAPVRQPAAPEIERPLHLLALSARSETALARLAARFEQELAGQPERALADLCFTANTGRAQFEHRLAVVADEPARARELLAAFQQGRTESGLVSGQAATRRPEIVFLFTGQGSQYVQMGRQLYDTQPVFRRSLEQCDELLRPYLERPLLSVLYPEPGQTSPLDETTYTQPALFALEYSLAELWRSWGVEPTVVMGHSVGEYVAACVAGVFSLEDGLKLIAERGRLMQSTAGRPPGEMAAVFADEARVNAAIQPYRGRVDIAAINGPEQLVISGEAELVQAVLDDLRGQRIRGRRLAISIAGHSPLMEPILAELEAVAASVRYAAPQIGLMSAVTGQLVSEEVTTAAYWRDHLRLPVRFYQAIQALSAQGYRLFVEAGPGPVLIEMGQRCLPAGTGSWLPSLRPNHDDWQQLLQSLAALYVHGVPVDWAGFERPYAAGRQRLPLPTYPFERKRHWVPAARPKAARLPEAGGHPLLGRQLRSPAISQAIFETELGATWPLFLDHHRIYGIAILPSPAYLEMALAAAQAALGSGPYAISNFTIHEAFVLPDEGLHRAQFILQPEENGQAAFQVFGLEAGEQWRLHATGALKRPAGTPAVTALELAAIKGRCSEEISGEAYYDRLRSLGLEFGTGFQGIHRLWRRAGEALGLVQLPQILQADLDSYQIHPAFLDACFHLLGAPLDEGVDTAYLLIGIEDFRLYRKPGPQLWNHTVLQPGDPANQEIFSGHMRLFDLDGSLVAEVQGLQLKRAGRETLLHAVRRRPDDWLYQVEWQAQTRPEPAALELPAPGQLADQVSPHLPALSAEHRLAEYRELAPRFDALCAAYTITALQELGWDFQPGQQVTSAELADRLSVTRQHRRLFNRLLAILQEEELLAPAGAGRWEVKRQPAPVEPEAQLASLLASYPAYAGELNVTGRCGSQLAAVLQGRQDPLHLLFPGGSLAETERLYQDSPFAYVYNTLIRETVETIVERLSPGQTLRILEIGAGTGATTSFVLPALPAGRVEYVFTDLSPLFTARAAEKFSDYPFVEYRLLDIENDPAGQGLAGRQFDLVIAANVLHATADLAQSLAHARQLLAPQGLLLLLEGTGPQRWVDLTFGLTEGWWKFTDTAVRPDYPLLPPTGWLELLQANGFSHAATIPGLDGDINRPEQVILLAQTASPEEAGQAGRWLILADKAGLGRELAGLLEQRGDRCSLVWPGESYAAGEQGWQVNPASADDFRRLVGETLATGGESPWQGIVHLWSLDSAGEDTEGPDPARLEAEQVLSCGSALHLVQALLHNSMGQGVTPPLWLVTSGGQPAGPQPAPLAVAQTPLWGLGRVIALEQPELWGGLIDLDPAGQALDNARYLLAEISRPDGEDQVAWRGGQRYLARLARAANLKGQPASIRPDGAYLITGGLGGLGLKVADWLAAQGARYLVLTGRRGLPERSLWPDLPPDSRAAGQVAAIQAIEAQGVTVVVEAADVSNPEQMRALFARFGQAAPPLRGIIHAAAALSGYTLQELPLAALVEMLKPKVIGTWLLHEFSRELPLDFLVLFSSTTALWGSRELGHYAAANAFLDGLAHYRRAQGLPALSINWGTWDEMRVASTAEQQAVAQFGLQRMPAGQALACLDEFLGSDLPQLVVAAVDWALLKPAYEAKRLRPFLQLVERATAGPDRRNGTKGSQARDAGPSLLATLASAQPEQRRELLVTHIRAQVARVLNLDPAEPIELERGLFEMGLDSLMSVELKSHLETLVETSLPSTLVFNYPTIADLAQYLETLVAGPAEAAVQPALELPAEPDIPENGAEADIDEMSEDELAALLIRKLERIE